MFKKFCLAMVVVLVVASVSFAGEVIVPDGAVAPQDSSLSDVFIYLAHVCDSPSSDCRIPDKFVFGTPRLYSRFWVPSSQTYARHYIVTDTEGAFVAYQYFSSSLSLGWNTVYVDQSLAVGNYEFTFIAAGTDGEAALSDTYKFRVY